MNPTLRADRLASVTAFVWPFLFLFPYVFPADGRFLLVGNDFYILYYPYKAYLLDALSRLDMPYWSPSEAAGFAFYSNPFGQAFYPLNVVLAMFYRLAGGWQALDHQRYAVLGIAIFSLGLFRWLRALDFSTRVALGTAMVMGVSFKLTELLRFPNALHTAAWYPWVLLYITLVIDSTSTRARATNALLLAGSLIAMMTGGYPYYVVYSAFLFGPYVVLRLVPRCSRALFDREPAHATGALAAIAAAGVAAIAITGPYFYKTAALMQQTTDRAGASFEYSTAHVYTLTDSLGAWIFPPASQIEGWYYFGMVNVLLIALFAIHRYRPLTLVLLAWIAVVTYITYGKSSYLFALLWHYVPGISSLRVWSRMNIILVPILGWLLASAYVHFESLLTAPRPGGRGAGNLRPLAILSAILAAAFAWQLYANAHWRDDYWTQYYAGGVFQDGVLTALGVYLKHVATASIVLALMAGAGVAGLLVVLSKIPANLRFRAGAIAGLVALAALLTMYFAGDSVRQITREQLIAIAEVSSIAFGVLSFAVLAVLLIGVPRLPSGSPLRAGALVTVVALAALDLWVVGPWTWAFAVWPASPRREFNIAQQNLDSFHVPRVNQQGLVLEGPFTVGPMDNWYFQRYNDFLRKGEREPAAKELLLGMVDGRKLRFSQAIDHASIQAFLDDARQFVGVERVVAYDGDELSVEVQAPADGYLSFIDNWDPDWEASVNGSPVSIELLFGTFKSVRLPAGKHLVVFRYRPFH